MIKKMSEYEIDKQKKKQLLVRNEFLYHDKSVGKYDSPNINGKLLKDIWEDIEFAGFMYCG